MSGYCLGTGVRRVVVGCLVMGPIVGMSACTSGSAGLGDGAVAAPSMSGCDNSLVAHHLGLAGGAVRHLMSEPYAAGSFAASASATATATSRGRALMTGAKAGALASRELTRTASLVRACPGTRALEAPLLLAAARSAETGRQLSMGTVDGVALDSLGDAVASIESLSANVGIAVVERVPTPSELDAVPAGSSP